MRKGEIACKKQFLHFSQCFLPYMALIFHFKCTLKCRLQFVSIWTSLKILSSGNGRLAFPQLQLSGTFVMKIRNTRKFSGTTMLQWLPHNINRAQVSAAMNKIVMNLNTPTSKNIIITILKQI